MDTIKYYIFGLLLFLSCSLKAQNIDYHFASPKVYHCDSIYIEKGEFHFSFNQAFTAVLISTIGTEHTTSFIYSTQDTIALDISPYDISNVHPSGFAVFQKPLTHFSISVAHSANYKIELFYAEEYNATATRHLNKLEDCVKPDLIERDEWRDGLADPAPGRTATDVKHCIIHHAASSNSNTDYTAVVRNIYLLHTQSNGWDDIGYNFLVAPDGTVYAGRDPLGVDDEDNIQGAHFCSKNSGTMGVCLLGNYEDLAPSDSMIESLISLLSWKLHKENLSAYDEFNHPDMNSDALGSIALHRNGCATQCPGDSVALLLDFIKTSVAAQLSDCSTALVQMVQNDKFGVFPNPSTGLITVSGLKNTVKFSLIDAYGKLINTGSLSPENNNIELSNNGIYSLIIFNDGETIHTKLVIISK